MRTSHIILAPATRIASVSLLALSVAVAGARANAQQPATGDRGDRDRGIELYKQGDATMASEALRTAVKRHKDDLTAWHYLGLALEKKGDNDSARKAFEKAAKLGDITLDRQLDRANSGNEVVQGLLSIRLLLLAAAESAEKYVALSPKLSRSKREEWNYRIDSLRGSTELASDLYSGKDVTTKARVLSKPDPIYSEEARKNQVSGLVILRCVFAANGRVTMFRVVKGLTDGLTESAIRAARQIRFIPATKDGKPVSMWMELQYHFSVF